MIRVSCPKCKATLQVEDKHAGQVIACSNCKTSLRLPQAPPAPPPSPPAPTIPKAIPTPPVLPAKQAAPAPAQPSPAQLAPAQPAAAENPASTPLERLRQGPLGKWLTPKWIAIGCGSVASVALVFVLLLIVVVGFFTRGSGGPSGKGGGGGSGDKSYTQRILDLTPDEQKECGVKIPKGAKVLFPPRSAGDFIQSLTLFNSRLVGYNLTDPNDPLKKTNQKNEIPHAYQMQFTGGVVMTRKCWDKIYGPQPEAKFVMENAWSDGRFGLTPKEVERWHMPCADETLLVRGESKVFTKKDTVAIVIVHFDKKINEICPTKGENTKPVSFKY